MIMRQELPERTRKDFISLFGLSRDEWEALDGDSIVLDCAQITRCPVEDPQTWMLAAFKIASDRMAATNAAARNYGEDVVQRAERAVKRIEDVQSEFLAHVERQKDTWDREGMELMTGILRRAAGGSAVPRGNGALRTFLLGLVCGSVLAIVVVLVFRSLGGG